MRPSKLLERKSYLDKIEDALRLFPIVALIGPRQVGKTSLARQIFDQRSQPRLNYFDLEDPEDENRLAEPKLALQNLTGLVLIDEIQRKPDVFPILRVLADRRENDTRFLVLGSASRELLQQSSESLAGRIKYIEISAFSFWEIGAASKSDVLLTRGGFPRSYLAASDQDSFVWRTQYVRTFLESDLKNLGIDVPPVMMRRLWMMLCHFHAQILNTAEIAQSLDISQTTAKRYIDILCGTFMIRRLQPWFENIGKRQVKSAKLYFRDSGIFHNLLGVHSKEDLLVHPALGRSWEGFAIEQIIRSRDARDEESYFWGVHGQGEIDLLIVKEGKREAFEIKYTLQPKISDSIRLATKNLKLDKVTIVYPGHSSYRLSDEVQVLSLNDVLNFVTT